MGDPKKISEEWKQNPTGAMPVAMALFAKMGKGDLTAIKEGLDRVEGKVTLSVSGPEGGPIEFREVTELTDEQLSAIIAAGEIVSDHASRGRKRKAIPENGSKPSD